MQISRFFKTMAAVESSAVISYEERRKKHAMAGVMGIPLNLDMDSHCSPPLFSGFSVEC